jgi:hypothetical protein
MAESEEERRKREPAAAAARPAAGAPTTPNSPMLNQPAPGSNLRIAQEQQRTAPKPEPIKTQQEVRSSLGAGEYAGGQTRGAGGVRLDRQTAPAGKELIGMKSGVPIYADAKNVYGVDTEARVSTLPDYVRNTPTTAAEKPGSMLKPQASQQKSIASMGLYPPAAESPNARMQPSKEPSTSREATDAEKNQRLQQARDAYQTGATASAVRAQAAPAPDQKRFGTATREDFDRAQAEARQRAMERLSYPRQDKPTSTTETSNAAASAMGRVAAAPKVASMEEVQKTGAALGFSPAKIKQLSFGVGDQGESLAVTPDYLKRLRQRAGLNY